MNKQLENPYFWARISGLCKVLAEDSKMDQEQREVLEVIGGLSGNDMFRLAIGYHDTEWMSNNK